MSKEVAGPARARRPADRDLLLRPHRHRDGPDRPPHRSPTLEYLVERGYRLTLTSLKCGHSFYTTSGNVSAHSSGNAVDIAQVNGLPILGNQGKGSITEAVVRDLLKLQGTMRPAQIITLMDFGGPTFAMGDHDDHIHVGYTPLYGAGQPVRAARPGPEARAVGAPDRPPRRDREPEGARRSPRTPRSRPARATCPPRPRSRTAAAAPPTAASSAAALRSFSSSSPA